MAPGRWLSIRKAPGVMFIEILRRNTEAASLRAGIWFQRAFANSCCVTPSRLLDRSGWKSAAYCRAIRCLFSALLARIRIGTLGHPRLTQVSIRLQRTRTEIPFRVNLDLAHLHRRHLRRLRQREM